METLIREILTAPVYQIARKTPLQEAEKLSRALGAHIFLKREDLQPVFSFKIRGAYNKLIHLSPDEREHGVICASAGNHAQGVALSARELGIPAIAVMPRTTPDIKVQAVKNYGARVVLHGDSFSEAAAHCEGLRKTEGAHFIHPFDDLLVIAGQGTIGREIMSDLPDLDAVFIPVGGGGLLAGVAAYLKTLNPEVRIIGVQHVESAAMVNSVQAGRLLELPGVGIFADGVAVKKPGKLTFELTRKYADEFILVDTDEICSAIRDIYEDTRAIVEPAGALAVAAIRKYAEKNDVSGRKLVAINSGANMNFDRLNFVSDRARVGAHQEALFAVTIPERAGTLKRFCEKALGERSITEFNYRLRDRGEAVIYVGIAIAAASEKDEFQAALVREGLAGVDLTENELAKNHIRHMVGGASVSARDELLYRFRFPERPGALSEFLNSMSETWNISLFNYRSQGTDYGRVLMGFEIPLDERSRFREFLESHPYDWIEENHNPAFKLFL